MDIFYWKSTCTTCRDARKLITQSEREIVERNYAKQPLQKAEIEGLIDTAGIAAILSTRNKRVKELGWKTSLPCRSEFIVEALLQNNVIRRPILFVDGAVVVGRDEARYRELLGL